MPKILVPFPAPTMPLPDWMLPLTEYDATFKGSFGDDNENAAPGGRLSNDPNRGDVVYTNGGNDYFATGLGNDKVTITPNQASSYIDVGGGADTVNVNARGGSHTVALGDGADTISVTGGGDVHIMAGQLDNAIDTLVFSSTYTGDATVTNYSDGDRFHFTGSGWSTGKLVDGGELFTNAHGGTVLVQAITGHDPMINDGSGWWHV